MLCVLLSGCTQVSKSENSTIAHTYAMIVMPDGSIIKGECSTFTRVSCGYAIARVNGIKYYLNEWRIVLWEE
jgi:hypothetical protein